MTQIVSATSKVVESQSALLTSGGNSSEPREIPMAHEPAKPYLPDPDFDPVLSRYWETGGTD